MSAIDTSKKVDDRRKNKKRQILRVNEKFIKMGDPPVFVHLVENLIFRSLKNIFYVPYKLI